MTLHILTRSEWKRCPTRHASYVDYMREMREIQEYLADTSQLRQSQGE